MRYIPSLALLRSLSRCETAAVPNGRTPIDARSSATSSSITPCAWSRGRSSASRSWPSCST